MPWGLGGDDGGFASVALLDDFEQMEALLVPEAVRSEVIENEQRDADELAVETRKAAIEAGTPRIARRGVESSSHLGKHL